MKKANFKAGLISLTHVREPFTATESINDDCINSLVKMGCEVISEKKPIKNDLDVENAIIGLKNQNIKCLFIIVMNWIEPPILVKSLHLLEDIPVILWGFPETDEYLDQDLFLGSSSAFNVIKSALEQMDFTFQFIMGLPNNAYTEKRLNTILSNIKTDDTLRNSKIGLIGYVSMGIYTATFDQLAVKKHFGIEIDTYADSYIIAEKMKQVEKKEVEKIYERIDREGICIVSPDARESYEKSIRMYIVLKTLAKERNWSGISVKCQHEFTSYLGCAACLPLSWLTDEGIMCSDEGDMHGLITMMIMNSFSDAPIFYGDIYPYNHNSFLMGHCGLVPHTCRALNTKVGLEEMNPRISEDGKKSGGIISSLEFMEGELTLCRIEGRMGQGYKMHIGEGYGTPGRPVFKHSSNIKVDINDASYEDFIEKQISNHYVFVYDRIKDSLSEFCKYSGIKIL